MSLTRCVAVRVLLGCCAGLCFVSFCFVCLCFVSFCSVFLLSVGRRDEGAATEPALRGGTADRENKIVCRHSLAMRV